MLYAEAVKLPEFTKTTELPQVGDTIGHYKVLQLPILRKRSGKAWHKYAAATCPHNPEPILICLEKLRSKKVSGCRKCAASEKKKYVLKCLVTWTVEGELHIKIVDTPDEAEAEKAMHPKTGHWGRVFI